MDEILLLNQAFFPDSVSTSQHATDLARELQATGHNITAVCGRRDYTDRARQYPRFEIAYGIEIHRVPSTWFGKGNFITRAIDAVTYDLMSLWRIARLPRHDLVIAFTSPPLVGLQGMLAARLWKARFVYWLMNINHEMAVEMGLLKRGSLINRMLTTFYRMTLRGADHVVVMDRFMKERVERERAMDSEKIAIVPLWPAQTSTDDGPVAAARQNPLRQKHGLEKKFVVALSGNLSVIHPLDGVLDAASVMRNDPSVVFVFIGHGARGADIDDRVRRQGLTNVLRLPYQPRESLAQSLGFPDLHLMVMSDASSGLAHASKIYSILESGRPFLFIGPAQSHVTTDIFPFCRGGFHVENGDVNGILRVIDEVRRLPTDKLEEISKQNRSLVRSQFNRQACVTLFAEQVLAPVSQQLGQSETAREGG